MKKKLLKALSTALVLAMVVALTIVGTVAYLNSRSNDVVNTFNISDDVKITMDEAEVEKDDSTDEYVIVGNDRVIENKYDDIYPGAELPKDPTVHVANDSADLYTRAYVTVTGGKYWLDLFGADYVSAFNALTDNTLGANWEIVDAQASGIDDVVVEILYTERLSAGDSTTPIFTEIEIPTSFAKAELDRLVQPDGKFEILAYAEALQAAGFNSAKAAFANYEGEFVVTDAASLAEALEDAEKGSEIIMDAADYGIIDIAGTVEDVTIVAQDGVNVRFNILGTAVVKDVTFQDLNTEFVETSAAFVDGGVINIDAGAQVEGLVVDGANIKGSGGRSCIIGCSEKTAEITVQNSVLDGTKYVVYASHPVAKVTLINNEIKNIGSWAIMMNAGDTVGANLTIDGNKFDNCSGGIAKYLGSSQPEGASTVFTDNTLTNCAGHDGSDAKWFTIPAKVETITVSGNTLDGADFVPGVAQGLGK
ncbi:MAG: right-handed parallel beta-helix repeat-containing protein [Firmicutes bacterium]|nr:right-handed parallel beta-helix repeat-containing protein [Bacillota bacterium]